VDLIKFDIEGAEWEVFGASCFVHGVRFIVGEMKGNASECMKFIQLFKKHTGYCYALARGIYYVFLRLKGE